MLKQFDSAKFYKFLPIFLTALAFTMTILLLISYLSPLTIAAALSIGGAALGAKLFMIVGSFVLGLFGSMLSYNAFKKNKSTAVAAPFPAPVSTSAPVSTPAPIQASAQIQAPVLPLPPPGIHTNSQSVPESLSLSLDDELDTIRQQMGALGETLRERWGELSPVSARRQPVQVIESQGSPQRGSREFFEASNSPRSGLNDLSSVHDSDSASVKDQEGTESGNDEQEVDPDALRLIKEAQQQVKATQVKAIPVLPQRGGQLTLTGRRW